jgi:transcriptional regulator with XRE-family HTH domain
VRKRSCNPLSVSGAARLLANLEFDSGRDPGGYGHAPKHTANMPWRYTLLTGNLAEIRKLSILLPEQMDIRDKLGVQIDASVTDSIYSKWNNVASKKIPQRIDAPGSNPLAEAVRNLRRSLGYSQNDMALALSVSQSNVAKWENGKLKPSGQILATLAKLAPDDERSWWLLQAGVKVEELGYAETDSRIIPVLRDPAAAGTPRMIKEDEIDFRLTLPRNIVPRGGKLVGLRVTGDSMSPVLENGYIALVDTSKHEPEQLVDRMVVARERDGVTLKWLRYTDGIYMLVPQNTSIRHPVHVIRPGGEWSIVGEVVNWIGWPANAPKRK